MELFFPDVTFEENFDRCSEWHGEEGTEESSKKEGPEEHGENDGHRVKADGVTDNLRSSDEGIDLLDDEENGDDAGDVSPLWDAIGFGIAMEVGNEAGGDEADDVADEGDDSEDGHTDADQEPVGKLEDGEGNADEDAIDEGDKNLSAEE